MAVTEFEICLQ